MKPTKRLLNLFTICLIAALLLTGAVPSFAEEQDSVVLPAIEIDDSDAPNIHGREAIVMDRDTGTVIYEKKADKVIEPASLTKILTFLVVMDVLDPEQEVTVPEDVETEGSVIWLEPGEKIAVKELYYGMMLESGNDAAQVLGLAASDGDLDKFSEMMNARAKECGAEHTDYRNPNGLNEDRSRLNYTTARDLALITREAMKYKMFRKVVKTVNHTIPATNKSGKRKLRNTNVCLWLKSQTAEIDGREVTYKYKGCNGVKTGFTSDAGFCYVGSAKRKNTDFIVISLGCEDSAHRYQDAIKLWNYGFKKYETYRALKAGEPAGVNRVWGGEKRNVEVGTSRNLGVTIYKGTADQQGFTTEFRLDNSKVEAPVAKGQKVGSALVFNAKGRLVGKEDLYTLAAVGEGGPLSHIGIADEDLPMAAAIAGGVLLLILILLIIAGKRRKKAQRRRKEAMRGELKNMRTAGTGMTARELTDVTGVEEFVPIPKGPERISDEELTAWSSTERRPGQNRNAPAGGSRFSSRSGQDGYRRSGGYGQGTYYGSGAPHMSKMQITPRTPFSSGNPAGGGGADTGRQQLERRRSVSDEELFAMLESTEVYDANQPRRHGRLTDTERREVMKGVEQESQLSGSDSTPAERLAERRRARGKRQQR